MVGVDRSPWSRPEVKETPVVGEGLVPTAGIEQTPKVPDFSMELESIDLSNVDDGQYNTRRIRKPPITVIEGLRS